MLGYILANHSAMISHCGYIALTFCRLYCTNHSAISVQYKCSLVPRHPHPRGERVSGSLMSKLAEACPVSVRELILEGYLHVKNAVTRE